MNLVIFLEQYEMGGVDTHLINLLRGWPASNDFFFILVNKDHNGLGRLEEELSKRENIRIIPYSPFSYAFIQGYLNRRPITRFFKFFSWILFPVFFFYSVYSVIRILKRIECDGILADNGNYPGGQGVLASIVASSILGIPKRILLTHHCAMKPSLFRSTVEQLIDELVTRSATDLVAVSLATRKSMVDNRGFDTEKTPIRVIYNGVLDEGPSDFPVVPLRQKFQLEGKLLVGIVGRVERYKGHEDLIAGLGAVPRPQRDQLCLLVIGSGHEEEVQRLKRMAAFYDILAQVVFTGFVAGSSGNIIKQLDLLTVMTKDFEGFGLTLGEAMINNVPVLATMVGAIPEFLTTEAGRLIPPESPFETTRALLDFVQNQEAWQKRAEKGKELIKNFGADRMGREFRALFSCV